MSYPEIDRVEKEQIEQVFGLTGGELADKPLRYAEIDWVGVAEIRLKRRWARYFYDGAPDYVERELSRKGGTYLTIVRDETFGEMPKRIVTKDGRVWRKIRMFRSSGEAECPWKDVADEDRPDEMKRNDPRAWKACPLCEAATGEDHGTIYIGEGWAEIVYRTRD